MQHIAAIYNAILFGLKNLAGAVIAAIFLLIVVDVFVRLSGITPWAYTSGLVEYGLLWFTMAAAPWLVRVKGHVFIDAAVRLLPGHIKKRVAKLAYLIAILATATLCYFSGAITVEAINSGEIDFRGEDMPLWTLLIPLPISFAMVAIEFTRFLIGIDNMYETHTEAQDSI